MKSRVHLGCNAYVLRKSSPNSSNCGEFPGSHLAKWAGNILTKLHSNRLVQWGSGIALRSQIRFHSGEGSKGGK